MSVRSGPRGSARTRSAGSLTNAIYQHGYQDGVEAARSGYSPPHLSFLKWLGNQVDRPDRIGELAAWAVRDADWPNNARLVRDYVATRLGEEWLSIVVEALDQWKDAQAREAQQV